MDDYRVKNFFYIPGIYPTNGPEACKYILQDSHCSILVVEDQKQLDKVGIICGGHKSNYLYIY